MCPELGLELAQLRTQLRVSKSANRLVVWMTAQCLWLYPSSLTPQSLPADSRNDVKIEYVVDARDPGKKTLTISAHFTGLAPGDITLGPLNPRENRLEVGSRINSLSLLMADGKSRRIWIKKSRFRFESDSVDGVQISYQLKGDTIANLGKSSYVDEGRCLLGSSDAFLVPEGARATIKVSFLLPEKWKVVTLATPIGPDRYEVASRKHVFFYLGEARGISERINNCAVTLAVEADWPMSSRYIQHEIRNQVLYLQSVAEEWKPRALLVVFLSPQVSPNPPQTVSVRKGDTIFLVRTRSQPEEPLDLSNWRIQLAEKLLNYFLSVARKSPEVPLQESLATYLAMKTCLKTGSMSQAEFLENISRGLQEDLNAESSAMMIDRSRKPREPVSKLRQVLNFFIVDLALAFEGRKGRAMIGVLQKSLQESLQESRRAEGDSLKKVAGEGSLDRLEAELSSRAGSDELAELLRPYGLILERIEMPHLSFELSETFQVSHVDRRLKGRLSGLQLGDRILGVNQNLLLGPTDLLKLRGSLSVGEDVILTVERDGVILKLKERLEGMSYCRLATNGLADSDKQQKLESFLAREVSN